MTRSPKPKSIAVEWEKKLPGFTEQMIAVANSKPDIAKAVMDFLAWEPTEKQRRQIELLGIRRVRQLTAEELQELNSR